MNYIILIVIMLKMQFHTLLANNCPQKCVCQRSNKYVFCKGKELIGIPIDIPFNTEYLDLSNNHIENLPSKSFINLAMLLKLDLTNNIINVIDENAFENLNSLKYLFLSNNDLSHIQEATFKNLPLLLHLNFANNKFTKIPPIFSSSLTRLGLNGNSISNIEFGLSYRANRQLRSITLVKNKIVSINTSDFENLRDVGVVSLILSQNSIRYIQPGSFAALKKNLQNLELNGNTLLVSKVIEEALKSFSNGSSLLHLNLDATGITEISQSFFKPFVSSRLSSIYLRNNPKLSFIDKEAFQGLHSLQKLFIQNCNLSSLNSSFHDLVSLIELYLASNKIQHCPTKLPVSISIVDLSYNNIKRILQNDFKDLSSLESLDLSHNSITDIEMASFSSLGRMKSLLLSFNNLTLFQYSNFVKRSLSSKAPNKSVFSRSRNLQTLDLSHNKIIGWPRATFTDLASSLVSLDLSFNDLKYLSGSSNNENYLPMIFTKLQTVSADNNKWNCSCGKVDWLLNHTNILVNTDRIICQYPKEVRGKNIFEINELKNCSFNYGPINPGYKDQKKSILIGVMVSVAGLLIVLLIIYYRKRLWTRYRFWRQTRYHHLITPVPVDVAPDLPWMTHIEHYDPEPEISEKLVVLSTSQVPASDDISPIPITDLESFDSRFMAYHCDKLAIVHPVVDGEVLRSIIVERTKVGRDTYLLYHKDEDLDDNEICRLIDVDKVKAYDNMTDALFDLY